MSEAPKYNNTPPDQRSGGVLRFLGGFAGGGHSSGGAAASIRSCSMLVRRTPRSYSVSRMSWSIPVTASWPTAALRVCRAARYPRWKASFPPPKPSPSGGRWAGPPGWFWWRVPSEALGRGCRRQVVRLGPAQVSPCEVGSRPVPGWGSRLSLEKARTQRVAGGCPPPPRLSDHSLLARSALALGGAARRLRDYYGTHVRALIWKLSFAKCFFSIFFRKNAPQIGLRIPEEIAPRTDQR